MMAVFFFIAHKKGFKFHANPKLHILVNQKIELGKTCAICSKN